MDLIELQDRASKCELCDLSKDRITSVFAKGNPYAKLMICGMCPGPDENDEHNNMGWPFVGRAGKGPWRCAKCFVADHGGWHAN